MRKEALFFSAIILMTIIAPRAVSGVTTIKTNTTIDSSDKWYGWDDRVEIRSNPTVNMIGGHADFIHTYNTSTLNKSGGKILRFRSYDSSVLNISDGGYISVFAVAWNSSSVNMTGGEIKKLIGRSSSMIQISNGLIGELSIRDNSEAQIDGGTIQYIDSQGNGVVNIIDGDIGNMKTVTQYGEGGLIGPGYINIIGGQVDGLYGEDFGEIEVTGGDITELGTRDMAVANIFGGSISHAFVEPDGVINIFGGNIDALVWNEPIIPSSLTLSAESESSIGGQIYIYGKSLYSTHVGGLYGYGYANGLWANGTAFKIDFGNADTYSHVNLVHEPAFAVKVDIKPIFCPNPLVVKSKGVLPVAILGSEDVNVLEIDVATIKLEGVDPNRSGYDDVAAPVWDPCDCNCTTDGPDGYLDLTLKFDNQEIVAALGDINDINTAVLTLTGNLYEEYKGTAIEGTDCIVIDRIPPSLDPVPSVTTLWPPNHKLHPVTIQANAFDNISNIVHLDVEVYSSEPANSQGDGNTMTDYYIDSINDETGLIELWLRAERSGKRNGRTYTIVITATDESDNSSVAEVYVVVPHNRGRSKK